MEEKDLWQNIDDGVCVGVEEPGGISYKEDLVKEGKEGIEANEGPHPTNQQGQNSHPDIGLLKKAPITFSQDILEKNKAAWQADEKGQLRKMEEPLDLLKMMETIC